ncbi:MAG: hypothetical protein JW729_09635 [Bacteroidales bacterium]|nr:hypothetical protein [Bacteroidales bacterium]
MKKILILLSSLFFFTACQYEVIKVEVIPPPDPNVELSFATDIVPIFTDGNRCTACHSPGKTNPDLTAANAYQSLMDGNFVVANDPSASLIYTYPHPDASTHRWKVYTVNQAELLFTWINQGVKNN